MQSILLVIQRPKETDNTDADAVAIGNWNKALRQFDREAEKISNDGKLERLNIGTYLIASNDGMKVLVAGIDLAQKNNFEYRILFLRPEDQFPVSKPTS